MPNNHNKEAPAGPNRVGQDWFRAHRGKAIKIDYGQYTFKGRLLRWDLYNLVIKNNRGLEVLIKQAPGMQFRAER